MGVAWRPAGGEHLLNTRSSTAKSRKSEKKLKFFVFPSLLSLIEDINGEVGGWMVSDLVSKCSAVMAPTCYSMKNLHYRTQSLPESVHQYNHLLNAHLGSSHHHPDYGLQLHPGKLHSASAIEKRAALRRTQSFYVPNHYMAPSSSHQLLPSSPYPSMHSQGNMLGMEQSMGPHWYHRSVPNLHPRSLPYLPPSQPALQQQQQPSQAKSAMSPLFVDCSVEYDLGEQPVIPADGEPLLSIHPEYVARSQNTSPYPLNSHNSSPHLALQIAEKSLSDSAPARLARRSHPRPSPHRSSRPSPRARASLAAKLEATRKLSVESRDSGIGLMNGYQQASSPVEPTYNQQTRSLDFSAAPCHHTRPS